MKKNFHFISGLPRSGSTLLANILAQNPRFHVSPTSGILDVLFLVRNQWDKLQEFQANPCPEQKVQVLKGILESFYNKTEAPVVFDRSRSWVAHLELAEMLLDREAKVLVPVRDVRDILASFEKLYRKSAATSQIPHEEGQYLQWQEMEYRCKFWARKDQVVGLAYTRIKDALDRGFADRMHFVPYERLTAKPASTMEGIYEFLGEEPFKHDFDSVKQTIFEDDRIHGFTGLHEIREKVQKQEAQWPKVIGDAQWLQKEFTNLEFWKNK